jgi:hypothetical protein
MPLTCILRGDSTPSLASFGSWIASSAEVLLANPPKHRNSAARRINDSDIAGFPDLSTLKRR